MDEKFKLNTRTSTIHQPALQKKKKNAKKNEKM